MHLRTACYPLLLLTALAARAYDPLEAGDAATPKPLDLVVKDEARKREIPVLVVLPAGTNAAPVVLFSHGLGGTRHGSAYLGRHWAARGYAVVFVQHPGSDDGVWRGQPVGGRMANMEAAASPENFLLRVRDVPAVIDQLGVWNTGKDPLLRGRFDLERIAMTGHSFGAVTTQALAGQNLTGGITCADKRIKAAIMFSPSGPRRGGADQAFGAVKLPWLLMTGTEDVSLRIGGIDLESRLAAFPAPASGASTRWCSTAPGTRPSPNGPCPARKQAQSQPPPGHPRPLHRVPGRAWLKATPDARAWLDGDGPRGVMEKVGDRWQRK
ncbi:MAG: dienelactone hydrolase [Kiritimatiellia bacterium]